MIETTQDIYNGTKKSLESLIRDKSYEEVRKTLIDKGINIDEVNDEDIEILVKAKVDDKMNGIKGFGVGTAFALAVSLITGF